MRSFTTKLGKIFILGLMVAGLMLAKPAYAATLLGDYLADKDIDVEVSASMDIYDKYVWRGFILDNDKVIQPAFTISVAGFEGGFWGSWDIQSKDALASDEVDGWLGYNFDLGFLSEELEKVGVSVGHTWYDFPEANLYTKESYLTVSLDTFLAPYVSWYHDYGNEENGGADGNYIMVGFGHSFDLNEEYGVTLDLGFEYGYNDEAFITDDGGYTLYTAGVTLPLTETITMSPTIGYSQPYGDIDDSNDAEFFGGVSIALN